MAAVGGSITEITYNHPTLGTGSFFPKASEDSDIDHGGVRTEDDDSAVDGSGELIRTMTQKPWSVTATIANDTNDRRDSEVLSALAGSPVEADWTFTHINGTIYGGKGALVGDVKAASRTATVPIKIQGGGTLQKL